MLMLKANRLAIAAAQALEAGDSGTGARMTAEAEATIQEAEEIARRAQAQ